MWISVDEYLAERKDCDVLAIILIIEYSALLCLEEIFKRRQGLHASRVHSCFVKSAKLHHRLGGEQNVEQKLSFTLLTQSNKHQTGYQCHLLRISAF